MKILWPIIIQAMQLLTISATPNYECADLPNITPREFQTLLDYQQSNISMQHENNWISISEYLPTLEPNIFVRKESNFIRILNLASKNIGMIDTGAFHELYCVKILLLQNNNIFNVDNNTFLGLSKVEVLDLSHNKLKDLPEEVFSNLPNLKILDLSYNGLMTLHSNTFANLTNLSELNMERNNIEDFPSNMFQPLPNLRSLLLAFNHISIITTPIVRHLDQLDYLNVSSNGIEYIYEAMFHTLHKLTTLDVSNNLLKSISIRALCISVPTLKVLNIDHNPWSCNKMDSILSDLELHGVGVVLNGSVVQKGVKKNEFGCFDAQSNATSDRFEFKIDSQGNAGVVYDEVLHSVYNLKYFVIVLTVLLIIDSVAIGFLLRRVRRGARGGFFSTDGDSLPLLNR